MVEDGGDQRRYAWRVLGLNVLVVSQPALTATMLTLAVPQLASEFTIGASSLAFLVSGYWLVSTILLLTLGGLADHLGRRRLYILGIALFTAGAVGCATAASGEALIAMRLLQAVGAAAIVATGTALLTDAFPPRLLSTALGLTGAIFAAFGLAGPVLGGLIAAVGGGRAIFWFSVPFGMIGLVLALLLLRSPASDIGPRPPFDVLGAVLSALGLTGLMIYLVQGPAWGWTSPLGIAAVTATAVVIAAFCWVELRREHPLLDLRLFGAWQRSAAYASHGLIAVSDLSVALLLSLYYQQVMRLSPVDTGFRLLPLTLGAMVAAPLAGRLAAHLPSRVLSSAGAALHTAALLLLLIAMDGAVDPVLAGCCLAAIGVGSSFFSTPNTSTIMTSVPASRRGVANALRSTIQNASGLAGTAFVLAVVGGSAIGTPQSTDPYRTVTLALAVLCALATVVSLSRGTSNRPPSS